MCQVKTCEAQCDPGVAAEHPCRILRIQCDEITAIDLSVSCDFVPVRDQNCSAPALERDSTSRGNCRGEIHTRVLLIISLTCRHDSLATRRSSADHKNADHSES
jgi:hypothetical protein